MSHSHVPTVLRLVAAGLAAVLLAGVSTPAADAQARQAGVVWSWGHNAAGQLGDGTTDTRPGPSTVPGMGGVSDVAAGPRHSLALRQAGSVWSWGANGVGQLGDLTIMSRHRPVAVTEVSGVVAVAAGNQHSLALDGDGNGEVVGAQRPRAAG